MTKLKYALAVILSFILGSLGGIFIISAILPASLRAPSTANVLAGMLIGGVLILSAYKVWNYAVLIKRSMVAK
jgi:hypothetical protein